MKMNDYPFKEIDKEDMTPITVYPDKDKFLLGKMAGDKLFMRCTCSDRQLALFVHSIFMRRPNVPELIKELQMLMGS